MSVPPAPLSLPLRKGALVTLDSSGNPASAIVFQYNPAELRRSVSPYYAQSDEEGERTEAPRFAGAARQTIQVAVQLDATDSMAAGAASSSSFAGIYPQLAALELLAYPPVSQVQSDQSELAEGKLEIIPLEVPRTLFVWGPNRVVPVALASYEVTEELFDGDLNPIRASANLTLRVLTYSDLDTSDPGYNQSIAYQQQMQTLAQPVTQTSGLTQATGVTISGS